jgi:hypothetical protein
VILFGEFPVLFGDLLLGRVFGEFEDLVEAGVVDLSRVACVGGEVPSSSSCPPPMPPPKGKPPKEEKKLISNQQIL